MNREWDDSVAITLEAYREMVAQRDRFRDEAARLKAYEEAWAGIPARCRNGMCCTQDDETRGWCDADCDQDDVGGCGVESCKVIGCQA